MLAICCLACQLLAALLAAASKNGFTGLSAHALEKAVYAATVTFFWLISSFWHIALYYTTVNASLA
jgi:hypothetical protein